MVLVFLVFLLYVTILNVMNCIMARLKRNTIENQTSNNYLLWITNIFPFKSMFDGALLNIEPNFYLEILITVFVTSVL